MQLRMQFSLGLNVLLKPWNGVHFYAVQSKL